MQSTLRYLLVAVLVVTTIFLFTWDFDDGGRSASASSKHCPPVRGAGVSGVPSPSPKAPVSVEWTGRPTMTVQFTDSTSAEVYRNDFIGSTLWVDFWDRVNQRRWESDTLGLIQWFLTRKPGAVYVDFGSWIGPTVLFAGQFAGAVYSLEPDPLSFSTLNANINLNPAIAAKTRAYFECIAPKTGPVEMSGSGESNTRMTDVLATTHLKAAQRWTVNCRTLPQFLADEKVDVSKLELIKMDTEGTELWLLPSLKPWLAALPRKPAIWLSVHSPYWVDATAESKQAVWDTISLYEYVYDVDLRRIHPRKMEPNLCPDFCTFLLSDVAYEGPGRKD